MSKPLLFDLPAKDGDKSAIASKAIPNLAKLSPAPLAEKSKVAGITPANYDEHLEALRGCDLIIEAIAERLDWKLDLYKKIAPYLSDSAVVASNYLRAIYPCARRSPARLAAPALQRHPLLQPAALHGSGRVDPGSRNRSQGVGRTGIFPDHHARQRRRLREGHAELHRQPHRRVLDPGHDAPYGFVQARLRPRRCADRPGARAAEERDLSHRRRGRPRHDGARDQDDGGHAAERSLARALPRRRPG